MKDLIYLIIYMKKEERNTKKHDMRTVNSCSLDYFLLFNNLYFMVIKITEWTLFIDKQGHFRFYLHFSTTRYIYLYSISYFMRNSRNRKGCRPKKVRRGLCCRNFIWTLPCTTSIFAIVIIMCLSLLYK